MSEPRRRTGNGQILESVTPSPKTLLISDKRDPDRIRKACGGGVRIIPIPTLAPQTILAVKEPEQFGHISKRLDGHTAIMMSTEGIIPVYL